MGIPEPIHGVLVLDKPPGPTSHDMVLRVRRILRRTKVGHLGTLDPFATGVLPLCLGKATRLARYLEQGVKCYEAEVRFGFATDTGDWTGNPLSAEIPAELERNEVERRLKEFHGTFLQTPPQYSARKVKGVRLYEYARKGKKVDAAPREVTVSEAIVLRWEGSRCWIRIRCSPGTYIRSIAADLGERLGCGGHLGSLRRTVSGEFEISQAFGAEIFDTGSEPERLIRKLIPLESLLRSLPELVLNDEGQHRVVHGLAIYESHCSHIDSQVWEQSSIQGKHYRLYSPQHHLVAIGRLDQGATLSPLTLEGAQTFWFIKPITVLA